MTNQSSQKQVSTPSKDVECVWWIGFTDREGPNPWWDKFTREGFRHIYMYAGAGEIIIVLNMTRGGLVMTTFSTKDLPIGLNVHDYLKQTYGGRVAVPTKGLVLAETTLPRFAPFTCVELARSILGIQEMLWTPFQLFKYITKNRLAGSPL